MAKQLPLSGVERMCRLGLWETRGVGIQTYRKLLETFESGEAVLAASSELLEQYVSRSLSVKIAEVSRADLERRWDYYQKIGARVVDIEDEEYPALLRGYNWSPPMLYVRGQLPQLNQTLAVVGTRKPTTYGRQVTSRLVEDLVHMGMVIVSGLALGIDGVAHAAALSAGGQTVALLGTGIDRIYPSSHERLAREIQENGSIISMFPAGQVSRSQFAIRNRLVAGMSLGVLVTEAAETSGTAITVNYAKEQHKPIFAVPGPITSAMSQGPLRLIEEGAVMVRTAAQIGDYLGVQSSPSSDFLRGLDESSALVLTAIERGSQTVDELSLVVRLPVREVMLVLSGLEIAGMVRSEGDRWIVV